MFTDTRRGDVWFAEIPENPRIPYSRVIRGYRPVLVISSNRTNLTGSVVTVIPMTSQIHHADGLLRVPVLPDAHNCLDKPSLVLTDQIMTVDRRALIHWVGCVSDQDMERIEAAVKTALALQ